MKCFYLRNAKGFPVTCVVSRYKDGMIYFAFSTHNPKDSYSKKQARHVAESRLLNAEPENLGNCVGGVEVQPAKGETKRRIVEEVYRLATSQAAKEAAQIWLQLQENPRKVLTQEAASAIVSALPVMAELFDIKQIERAMAGKGYDICLKSLFALMPNFLETNKVVL